MSESKQKAASKEKANSTFEDELKDTFPASDPPSATQPGGGITGTEPPPKGSAQRDTKKS